MEQMDKVKAELRKEEQDQNRRLRLGEITDIKDPKTRTPRHQERLTQLAQLGGGPEEASGKERVRQDLYQRRGQRHECRNGLRLHHLLH